MDTTFRHPERLLNPLPRCNSHAHCRAILADRVERCPKNGSQYLQLRRPVLAIDVHAEANAS
jgi:hypothetical protein